MPTNKGNSDQLVDINHARHKHTHTQEDKDNIEKEAKPFVLVDKIEAH